MDYILWQTSFLAFFGMGIWLGSLIRREKKQPLNSIIMNQKAAIILHLLQGKKISIMDGFKMFGITNVPREIGRSVERAFHVTVERTPKEGKTRYNSHCTWVEYKLNRTKENQDGIQKMKEYLKKNVDMTNPKTERDAEIIRSIQMVLRY